MKLFFPFLRLIEQLVLSACVLAEKGRTELHHCVVFFFWALGLWIVRCVQSKIEVGSRMLFSPC